MGATWLYEHKQNHKKSSLRLSVRFWNNLIEMFLEWPFSELFLKFWSVNKHSISEWRLLALYKEILVNSSLKATKKILARAISKNQVGDPGPSWPACYVITLSQTIPAFYVSALQVLWKHCGEKKKLLVTSNFFFFPTVFSIHLENFLPFSSTLKLSSANAVDLKESKVCCLGKG